MDPAASRSMCANGLHLAYPDIAFVLFPLESLMTLFSPLERECAQRVAFARHPRTSRACGRTASTVWTKKPRPRSLPICLNEADLVTMEKVDVGGILHQQHHGGGRGLFPALLQVRLQQRRKADIWLIQQPIQGFDLFPGVHLSWRRTQGVLRQVGGCFYRSSRSTDIVQLDAPKGSLGPALGVQHFLCVHPFLYHFGTCG